MPPVPRRNCRYLHALPCDPGGAYLTSGALRYGIGGWELGGWDIGFACLVCAC